MSQNKKKKIQATEDAMQAKITELKKCQEALRKRLENLVQNTEIVRQLDVNTTQLDSSSIQELINTITPQDDVEEGCSGAKGPDEEADSYSAQQVILPIDSKSELSAEEGCSGAKGHDEEAESEQEDIPPSDGDNDFSDPFKEHGRGNDNGSEYSSDEGEHSPSRKRVKMD